MAQFKSFAEGIEVNGETIWAFVAGLEMFQDKGLKILSSKGIVNPKPGLWYPQQAWLDAFKEISEKVGHFTLLSIGKKIPENAQFPPEIDSLEKALSSIDIAYHINHRRDGQVMFNPETGEFTEGIGHYTFYPPSKDEKKATMVCENPYPCEFDKGIIEAMAKRFKPKESISVMVKHDNSKPCRKKGANSCTYIIEW